MADEPRYVDDPFEDDAPDLSTNGIENLAIIQVAQKICRRPSKPFHSMAEKRKWLKIDKQHSKGMISMAWIANCCEWARETNKERLIILMPALASLILNKARMTDWQQKYAEDAGEATDDDKDLAEDGF